ncbi:hypothetical protein UJ101_00349 [Flavobacteriaceae bacterium UJ101]|nr:hypothetical protein UJ101_00349 [Flavobacteriaceae bacterium UJ101]
MKKLFTTFLALSLLNLNYSCSEDENVLQTNSSNAIVNFEKTIVSNNVGNSSRRASGGDIDEGDMIYQISNIVTDNEEYNDIVHDMVYEVNLDLMEVKVSISNYEGFKKYDLVLNSEGLYDMIEKELVNTSSRRGIDTLYGGGKGEGDKTTDNQDQINWEVPGWLCAVGCGASAFAMSLADGPAPVADAIAIGYAIQCGSEC